MTSEQFRMRVSLRNLAYQKKAASDSNAAMTNVVVNSLEREIHASANHAKVIVGAIDEIPAEITDPANMGS